MAEAKNSASEKTDGIAKDVADQMLATVYGQCIGDALGLLTEFLTKDEAKEHYGKKPQNLQFSQKAQDLHRSRWKEGDWTDDTDQMILIMLSILCNKGEVVASDFAVRILRWRFKGYPELGDYAGMGIGTTTSKVLHDPEYLKDPQKAAFECWDKNGRDLASNGGVMRTSILGLHQYQDLEAVMKNTLEICKTTHYDPRCQASSVAVSTCIALMLQCTAQSSGGNTTRMSVDDLIKESYKRACQVLTTNEEKKELWTYMSCTKLKNLKLAESGKIGYTYKCLGSGFWALKQDNFQNAMIKLVMEGGDADTNGSVAGALLGCRLGLSSIPESWIMGLKHREWVLAYFNRFLTLQSEMNLPIEDRTPCPDLTIKALNEVADEKRKRDQAQREKMEKKE